MTVGLVRPVWGQLSTETQPQVWIDKNTFYPLRCILAGNSDIPGQDLLEIRYDNWQEYDSVSYPMRIEFIQDGMLVREIRVESVTVDAAFSETLFDIPALQSQFAPARQESTDTETINEVRKTIEEFKRRFE